MPTPSITLEEAAHVAIRDALLEITAAELSRSAVDYAQAVKTLEDLITWSSVGVHLQSAEAMLKRAEVAAGTTIPNFPSAPASSLGDDLLARVPFREAIRQIAEARPILVVSDGVIPAFRRLQDAYRTGGVFGASGLSVDVTASQAAQQAARKMTEHVRTILEGGVTAGTSSRGIADVIVDATGFADSYAENIVRTNLTGAAANGTVEAANLAPVKAIIPALRYHAVRDVDTRLNHLAANGMVLPADDPLVRVWNPPSGYNCRCSWDLMNINQLRRLGLYDEGTGRARRFIPEGVRAGARPDPGFG